MATLEHNSSSDRVAQVWAQIARVTDPELDESVTELGFVTDVAVDEKGGVCIDFRLPTYWCAANFAFLMADDLCRAARRLHWVTTVSFNLQDHVYAKEINRGVATGQSFKEIFAGGAEDDLDKIRETFRRKAFQRRQEAVIKHLLAHGYTMDQVIRMELSDLDYLSIDADGQKLVARYLELRGEWKSESENGAEIRAFVTPDGAILQAESFDEYLKDLQSVRLNVEFNGIVCRGLLAARYPEDKNAAINNAQGNGTVWLARA